MAINFTKYFTTKSGQIIISAILGFGLASLFRAVCKDKNCIIKQAPPIDEIDDKVYQFENKCYTYTKQSTKCKTNIPTINT